MSSKIKDLVEIVSTSSRAASHREAPPADLATFLMSYEVGDAIARTVERLTSCEPGPHNSLVVGGPGCGKSRLLRTIERLLQVAPSTPMHSRLAEIRATVQIKTPLLVAIPSPQGDRRLAPMLERGALECLASHGYPCATPDTAPSPGAKLDLLAPAVAALPPDARLVFVVDDLDRWLDTAARYALENAHALVRLGELSTSLPLAVCAAAGEYVLTQDTGASGQGWIAALLDCYRIEYVPARALRTATASNVLVKNARQRHEIAELLKRLRTKLPDLECAEEEFVELYPLEVSTWTVGSHLHRWIDGFSFPNFAERAAESVKRRPALSLFALNDMFTLYEPQLRHAEALGPSFAAYDRLVADALPRLGAQQRLWGRLALQSIFMHTLAGIAADVKTIANSVLLYDLHGSGSSYTMMAAVLKQLETLDRGTLVATGDGAARRYSLVTGEREALLMLVDEMADAMEDEETVWALLGVGGHIFADWPFAGSGPERGRLDLWEIEQGEGRITIVARALENRDTGELTDRPRLVIFSPGRPWSEASEEVRQNPASACWIGAMPTPAERCTIRRWLAASRLASSDRGRRFTDLASVLSELELEAVEVFRRVYVDGGTRVTSEQSNSVADMVDEVREENLVVRLLPVATQSGVTQRPSGELATEGIWIAHLLSDDRKSVEAMATWLDADGWLHRLEAWYGGRVGRDDTGPMRLLGEQGAEIPEVLEALEAKQVFDVALYYVRRALASRSVRGLGEAIEKVFETPDRLWEARERLVWLERFADWVPSLEHARHYLQEAETVEDDDVESLRESLLSWLERIEDFVSERRRKAFTDSFEAYREEYARIYVECHDEYASAVMIDRLSREIVESASWRALEALSSLSISNQSYLVDAINLISALRDAQCTADAESVLARTPLCACGFRFTDRERIATMAASAHDFVESGITHHRGLLQARRTELRDKIIACKSAYGLDTIRTIAELTKDGPTPEIDAATVDALNDLLSPSDTWFDSDKALTYPQRAEYQ